MLRNNKGFTLMEIMIVVLILGTLASIAVPQYNRATKKAKVAVNLPLMRALRDDIINFYILNHTKPTSLFQLSLNRGEFDIDSETVATHKSTNCTISLKDGEDKSIVLEEDCGQGWYIKFVATKTPLLGYVNGPQTFHITDDFSVNQSVAKSLGWEEIDEDTYKIQ